MTDREAIAREIWLSEYRRATGKERVVDWEDGVSDNDRERYLYVADAVLALPQIGALKNDRTR
jgi:hypothetical protein